MFGIPCRSQSATCSGFERSDRIAPNTFGVSVFTRPPRISGAPDQEAIGVTGMPASCRCFAVPPVERISTFFAARARARSRMPVLSETERMARSIDMQQQIAAAQSARGSNVAAGFLPDVVVEIHEVGDGVRVADGRNTERSRAIVEIARAAGTLVFGVDEWTESRRAVERAVDVARHAEVHVDSVEDGRELLLAALEVVLEIAVRRRVRIGDQMRERAEVLDQLRHRLARADDVDRGLRLRVDLRAHVGGDG